MQETITIAQFIISPSFLALKYRPRSFFTSSPFFVALVVSVAPALFTIARSRSFATQPNQLSHSPILWYSNLFLRTSSYLLISLFQQYHESLSHHSPYIRHYGLRRS